MTTDNAPTIASAVAATKRLAICARLLARAGLDEVLQGDGRYTLFAPIDAAFDELPPGMLASLEGDPPRLRAALEYHVLGVDREVSEIRNGKLPTLEGTLLTSSVTDDGLRLDHANVLGHPVRCANGVIYQIGAVLLPGYTPAPSTLAPRESPWSGSRRGPRNSFAQRGIAVRAADALFLPPGVPRSD